MKGIRAFVVAILRILSLFFLILTIIAFFTLLTGAQFAPNWLAIVGGGISSIMALIVGLSLFCLTFCIADSLKVLGQLEEKIEKMASTAENE